MYWKSIPVALGSCVGWLTLARGPFCESICTSFHQLVKLARDLAVQLKLNLGWVHCSFLGSFLIYLIKECLNLDQGLNLLWK